ncbi:phosphoglucomutase [Methanohalophilus levihalophilus]|nr:phosphoglucomutase [Methanohalophilus levihalophilus]
MESICVDTVNGSVECYPDEIIKNSNLENLLNPDEMIVSIRFLCHVCDNNILYRLKSEDKSVQLELDSISQKALDDMDNLP